ncbi:MAG: hypothetical protein JOY99_12175 [Sphingomonadaceae bacterium]|nr:hypothetical protein [Sphingomonadaceae bacterium]
MKVIQWYTGSMGAIQVELLRRDRKHDLVGVVAYSPDKVGLDAGEVTGIGAIGLPIVDAEAGLAIDSDVVLMNGNTLQPDLVDRILRSGKNVITISGAYEMTGEPEYAQLEAAAQAGGVTLTGGGNMPGLLNDVLPLFMSGYTSNVTRIWTRERNCHADYRSRTTMAMFYGHPMPLPEQVEAMIGSSSRTGIYYQSAKICAKAFGLELSDFRLTNYEVAPAPEDFTMPGTGVFVAKGTVAASRYEFTGFVDGQPWHTVEMEFTARLGLGPQWRSSMDESEFFVAVDGDPPLRVTWGCGGLLNLIRLNAARMINLIEPTVAAPPGCRSILELPCGAAGVLAGKATAPTRNMATMRGGWEFAI